MRERERAAKRGTEPKGGNRKASKEGGDRCGDRLVRTRVARVFRLFCARERKKERKKEEKNETGFFVQGGEERRRRTSATMQSAQDQQLKTFWDQQMQEVKEVPTDTSVFKNHQLPLARIKKVSKLFFPFLFPFSFRKEEVLGAQCAVPMTMKMANETF